MGCCMEQWRAIPGYEGLYEASDYGRIRTAENKTTYTAKHGERRWKQRVLKPKRDKQNCLRVALWKDGKAKDFLVARLVCATWHDNLIDTKMTVNHIDGNRLNNNANNLEWLSRGDNIRHGFETGLYGGLASKVELIDVSTSQETVFRSMAAASRAIGRNKDYIANCLKNNNAAIGFDGRKYQVKRADVKP